MYSRLKACSNVQNNFGGDKSGVFSLTFCLSLGRSYDNNGNIRMWWSKRDLDVFKGRYQCMIDQYSNFTDPMLGLNVSFYGI